MYVSWSRVVACQSFDGGVFVGHAPLPSLGEGDGGESATPATDCLTTTGETCTGYAFSSTQCEEDQAGGEPVCAADN